jgi:hypothetical protein
MVNGLDASLPFPHMHYPSIRVYMDYKSKKNVIKINGCYFSYLII